MAARLRKFHQDEVRKKIKASLLIKKLTDHVLGDLELSATQVSAANSLLDRSVAKLSQVQLSGDEDNPLAFTEIERRIVDSASN